MMIKLKNYITGVSVMFSALMAAQLNSSSVKQYPTMYENQNSNLPTHTAVAAEKVVLTAKELVDINLNSMMNDPVLKNADWGFVVYDPKTKKVISSYNETASLIPASTTKLLTTETALRLLGDQFRWITQLEHSGEVDAEGNLNGNLYIVGSGDPSLGTGKAGAKSYSGIAGVFLSALQNQGIKKVNGSIIIQNAVFKENKRTVLPQNIVWLEHHNYYLPVGATANINPANEKLMVKKASPFEMESKKYFYISPYINQMVYAEKFEGASFLSKLPDAPYTLANTLRSALVKNGISVSGKVETRIRDMEPESRRFISFYKSPSLGEIVQDTNQRSDNALAEALLRMVGFQQKGDQTIESGRAVVVNHLNDIGFDVKGLNYHDGSGLSRNNLVTPIAQVKYLTSLMGEKFYKIYFDSLPIAGKTGTLKKSFQGAGYGQVFAKTGTLNKVKTLAGYLKTNTGRTLVFSLMVNNYAGSVDQVKQRMEKILAPTLSL